VIGAQSVGCPNKGIDLSWQLAGFGFVRKGKTPVLILIANALPSGSYQF
jgi:hypothetical protein